MAEKIKRRFAWILCIRSAPGAPTPMHWTDTLDVMKIWEGMSPQHCSIHITLPPNHDSDKLGLTAFAPTSCTGKKPVVRRECKKKVTPTS